MNVLPVEFTKEPALALYGGVDGLDFVKQLINESPKYLSEEGVLIVECGKDQKTNVESLFPQIKFNWITTSVGEQDVFIVTKKELLYK